MGIFGKLDFLAAVAENFKTTFTCPAFAVCGYVKICIVWNGNRRAGFRASDEAPVTGSGFAIARFIQEPVLWALLHKLADGIHCMNPA